MFTQRSSVDLPEPEGPMITMHVALAHAQVHPPQHVEIAEPLVDTLEPDEVAARGCAGDHQCPAPAIPTSPLWSRFSTRFTRKIAGRVIAR